MPVAYAKRPRHMIRDGPPLANKSLDLYQGSRLCPLYLSNAKSFTWYGRYSTSAGYNPGRPVLPELTGWITSKLPKKLEPYFVLKKVAATKKPKQSRRPKAGSNRKLKSHGPSLEDRITIAKTANSHLSVFPLL